MIVKNQGHGRKIREVKKTDAKHTQKAKQVPHHHKKGSVSQPHKMVQIISCFVSKPQKISNPFKM
jgi:hypothetical protein